MVPVPAPKPKSPGVPMCACLRITYVVLMESLYLGRPSIISQDVNPCTCTCQPKPCPPTCQCCGFPPCPPPPCPPKPCCPPICPPCPPKPCPPICPPCPPKQPCQPCPKICPPPTAAPFTDQTTVPPSEGMVMEAPSLPKATLFPCPPKMPPCPPPCPPPSLPPCPPPCRPRCRPCSPPPCQCPRCKPPSPPCPQPCPVHSPPPCPVHSCPPSPPPCPIHRPPPPPPRCCPSCVPPPPPCCTCPSCCDPCESLECDCKPPVVMCCCPCAEKFELMEIAHRLEQFEMPPPDLEPLKEANLPIIWVLGGPGSGKGTQCDLIVVKYGYTHISTGDLLRADVDSGSVRGRMLQKLMKEGILVPTNIVLGLLLEKMMASIEKSKGFLIDGFPREIPQAEIFEKQIGECTAVLYFEVKDETMIQRLMARGKVSGRVDDNEETIRKRLDIFHMNNDPIIKKYASKVKTFSGEDPPREIFAKVADVLEGLADAPATE